MGISQYLSKFALGVSSQGVLSAAKGGTGSTSGGGSSSPAITAVGYPGNDTAVNTSGGDTVTLTGTNFNTGVNVIVNGIAASVVSRVSATQLTFTAPAQATGSYIIYVVNTDGSTGLAVPGLLYSPVPAWTTAAGSLGSPLKNVSFTATLASTGDAPITYSLFSGTLPSGITLNSSTGILSGTTPNVAVETTYNFTIRATDAQNQDTNRSFSLTVLPLNPTPTVDYVVVAGGGGAISVGGGGAGGMLTGTGFSVTSSTLYTVTVGAGGIGRSQGNNSVFSSITTIGGGTGRVGDGSTAADAVGGSGGSGAGGAYGSPYSSGSAGGAGTAGQGNAGGNGAVWVGGGGGGGGGAGSSGTGQTSGAIAGNGGPGIFSSQAGVYLAGGGGGGAYGGSAGLNANNGGIGGGGHGLFAYSGSGGNGTVNTGGGAGGFYDQGSSNGGSGVVRLQYLSSYSPAQATTGSPTVVVGTYRVYTFTSSGSITF